MAKIIKGAYKLTIGFGVRFPIEEFPASVVKAISRYPWIDLSRGWKTPHAVANEYGGPKNTVNTVLFPVPVKVVKVWTRTDKTKVVECAVNIVGHKWQGKVFRIEHLGKVLVKAGEWKETGTAVGYFGGKYGFTGPGTGPHIGLSIVIGGKYVSPQPLIDWKKPIVAKVLDKVVEVFTAPKVEAPPTTPSPQLKEVLVEELEEVSEVAEEVKIAEPKNGLHSTEFYLGLVTQLIGVLSLTGVISPEGASVVEKLATQVVGLLVALVGAYSYMRSRTEVKTTQIEANKDIAVSNNDLKIAKEENE